MKLFLFLVSLHYCWLLHTVRRKKLLQSTHRMANILSSTRRFDSNCFQNRWRKFSLIIKKIQNKSDSVPKVVIVLRCTMRERSYEMLLDCGEENRELRWFNGYGKLPQQSAQDSRKPVSHSSTYRLHLQQFIYSWRKNHPQTRNTKIESNEKEQKMVIIFLDSLLHSQFLYMETDFSFIFSSSPLNSKTAQHCI